MWLVLLASLSVSTHVTVDPGHGGSHDGAHGVCGVWEKEIALKIATRLVEILEKTPSVEASLTRTTDRDLELEERTELAEAQGADMFVSVHANAGPNPEFHGIETYFLSARSENKRIDRLVHRENRVGRRRGKRVPTTSIIKSLQLHMTHAKSQQLAHVVQNAMVEGLDVHDRGVQQAPFAVLRYSTVPAVLVEVGFLTNPQECAALATKQYRDQVAKRLAIGIVSFALQQRMEQLGSVSLDKAQEAQQDVAYAKKIR